MTPTHLVEHILTVYAQHAHRQYGENVTALEHALQTATFAQQFGEPTSLVAAALLHDYGHLLHDLGEDIAARGVDAQHEHLGAEALASVFIPAVVEPIRWHVAAKRYLCWQDRAYYDGLSEASRQSLQIQGGPMTDQEASAFAQLQYSDAAVRLRRYDDMGKVPGMLTPAQEDFRGLLESYVCASGEGLGAHCEQAEHGHCL